MTEQRLASTRAFRTVAKLTAAATAVFAEQGFHAAQVGDLAAAAGISRATFYNYFSSKEALLRHMVQEALPDLVATGEPAADGGALDRIRASTEAYLDAYQRHAVLMHIWNEAAQRNPEMAALLRDARRPFLERTEHSIRRLQASGRADPAIDAGYAAYALTGMVASFAFTWFVEGQQFDRETAVDVLCRLWANSIGLSDQQT